MYRPIDYFVPGSMIETPHAHILSNKKKEIEIKESLTQTHIQQLAGMFTHQRSYLTHNLFSIHQIPNLFPSASQSKSKTDAFFCNVEVDI